MSPHIGDTQKVNLYCTLIKKEVGVIQKYCEIYDTQNNETEKFEWVNDICLNRYDCQKKEIVCRFSTRDLPDLPNPFK